MTERSSERRMPTPEEVKEAYLVVVTTSPLNHHPDYMVGVGPNWREDFDAAVVRLQEAAEVLFADKHGYWPDREVTTEGSIPCCRTCEAPILDATHGCGDASHIFVERLSGMQRGYSLAARTLSDDERAVADELVKAGVVERGGDAFMQTGYWLPERRDP